MTNVTGTTPDIAQENIEKLKTIFPDVFTEGKIDFDKFQQVLGNYIETSSERYNFTWNGKSQALRLAQTPSMGTLRPCKKESKDWDTTENLYIEGDNLEVLKLLQKSYHGKVKMIYIDPPYNTGGDFVYQDNFKDSIENYKVITGQIDSEGNSISSNSETSGRYHTDWLNMMYPRLRLARNLLSESGVIFISIDDNEVANLKKMCDEILGENCFLGCVVRSTGQTTGQDSAGLGSSFDYLLIYSKDTEFELEGLPLTEHDLKRFNNKDERGDFAYDQLRKTGSNDRREDRPNMYYSVTNPDGNEVFPIGPSGYESCWRFEKKTYEKMKSEGYILWKKTTRNTEEVWWPYVKYYLEGRTKRPSPLWTDLEGNKKASRDIRSLFENIKVFDYAKPIEFLQRIVQIAGIKNNDIVFDFFSGSATTAHAVMQLNAEDQGKRKFIMVQLPEPCDEKSEAYKAGYSNICEIGKERIRRAGEKIKEEAGLTATELDIGFKVFKLDTSNIRKWQPDYNNIEQSLTDYVENYVDGRSELDVVYEIILKCGLDLTYPIDEYSFDNKKVYTIGFGALMICLAEEITANIAQEMVKMKNQLSPETWKVVFKDNGFKSDSDKTNIKEILKCGGLDEDAFTTL